MIKMNKMVKSYMSKLVVYRELSRNLMFKVVIKSNYSEIKSEEVTQSCTEPVSLGNVLKESLVWNRVVDLHTYFFLVLRVHI